MTRSHLVLVLSVCVFATRMHAQSNYEPYSFVTFAGLGGTPGSLDGPRSFARFGGPSAVAVDSAGNVYVSDYSFNNIRKITPAGSVSTLAGLAGSTIGSVGISDGRGTNARFNGPSGLAVDSNGNVYVADQNNHTVRKITPGGDVTTFAGSAGIYGNTDGNGTTARFANPTGLAIDSGDNVYVADTGNSTIRKITPAGVVSTLAGMSGRPGSSDGPGSTAQFYYPTAVTVDNVGNVYVADTSNHTIREITPAGVVSTLAGMAGSYGSADGVRSAARFSNPNGVTVGSGGDIYVADTTNDTIRKITPTGIVSTFAGSIAIGGSSDGPGNAARFNNPEGVTTDSTGNIYVADDLNDTVRKITTAGIVTTVAGFAGNVGSVDGFASAARFSDPSDVGVDGAGNVYVADIGNETIRKITPAGVVSTIAGSTNNPGSADGTGSGAQFRSPSGITVDGSGNLYVADLGNSAIRKVTPAGVVTTVAGSAGNRGSADGIGSAARFSAPISIAMDAAGNLYVADYDNNNIRKIASNGAVSTLAGLAGTSGSADGPGSLARFNAPRGVAVDSTGTVYVADEANNTVRKITSAGVVSTLAGSAGASGNNDGTGSGARFFNPSGVGADASGNVYVADYANATIRKITPSAVVTTLAGLAGNTGSADGIGSAARFFRPARVAVNSAGDLYVADVLNCIIRAITPNGVVSTIAGLVGISGSNDGMGCTAQLHNPTGVAVDSAGNVYVTDSSNQTIRKITPDGLVGTFAGLIGSPGSSNGSGNAARFNNPFGIAADTAGNIYVSDANNQTIRRITPAGVVSTLAGVPGSIGSADGMGSAARFDNPSGVAVDGAGNIYVADTSNHTIRKITSAGVVSTFAGFAGNSGSVDGNASVARFNSPGGVAVDTVGNVYVADTANNTIRKITPVGVVSTLAGLASNSGSADGIGSAARFSYPQDIAVDILGNVFVADTANHIVRKITRAGLVTTLAGSPGNSGTDDGTSSTVRFNYPTGAAMDSTGHLYIADNYNYTIRLGTPLLPLVAAVSHKAHGSVAGDIDLLTSGAPAIECRSDAASPGTYQLIMMFAGAETTDWYTPLTVTSATITLDPNASPAATGNVSGFRADGSQVTVTLSNISNAQTILVNLSVNDGSDVSNVTIPMGVLLGDVNGSGRVDAADVSFVRQQTLQPITSSNFRADINASGRIDAADVSIARQQTLTSLP